MDKVCNLHGPHPHKGKDLQGGRICTECKQCMDEKYNKK